GPLKPMAEWNPVSAITQAVRTLFGNTSDLIPVPDAWPLRHPVLASAAWIGLILIIFVPLAVNRYNRAAAR
ncbi:MAG: ABC transporter permease, partial [Actinomycetota bacterium]